MTTLKKAFKTLVLSFIIILAATGAGFFGAFLPNNNRQFMDKEIRIEQIDKNRNEEEENSENEKS